MPLITVKTIKGILSQKQKYELHKKIVDVIVEVEGNEAFRNLTMVVIEEQECDNFSMGGVVATPELLEKISAT